MPAKFTIALSDKFGRLTVIAFHSIQKHKRIWLCLCDCGNTTLLSTGALKTGNTKSCGCARIAANKSRTTERRRLPEFYVWSGMIARCYNPNDGSYERYGGRGITVCERWLNFDNFILDMGRRPSSKHSIERINNSSGYEPANCKWALPSEQARNRRSTVFLTYQGITLCMLDWANLLGLKKGTLSNRKKYGWSVERMLTTPLTVRQRPSADLA